MADIDPFAIVVKLVSGQIDLNNYPGTVAALGSATGAVLMASRAGMISWFMECIAIRKVVRDKLNRIPQPSEEYTRPSVHELGASLRGYREQFQNTCESAFVLLSGPEASGKTSAVRHAFSNTSGTLMLRTVINPQSKGPMESINEALLMEFGSVAQKQKLECIITKADWISRMPSPVGNGVPLLLYWSISVSKTATLEELKLVAHHIAFNAKSITHDNPGRSIPLVVEISHPVLGFLIPRVHNWCTQFYVHSSSFEDLLNAFDENLKKEIFIRHHQSELFINKLLSGTETQEEEDGVGNRRALGKECEAALKLFYSYFGSHLRELQGVLEDVMAKTKEDCTSQELLEEFELVLKERYTEYVLQWNQIGLTPEQEAVCTEIAKAGPSGFRVGESIDKLEHIVEICNSPNSLRLLRRQDGYTFISKMAHVRHLLSKNAGAGGVLAEMDACKWFDKTTHA
eukprot:TRINITY_DN4488_c2_g1_i1.p1 TRINITY_DN4488_c2_g1~~TRINITY_DN4488_c2_g1_i1.p1  ORF type:complete len:467 (+),score=74.44 TRINITY_DN4488_c2_g1_i1:28-1401(+)